MQHFPCLSLIHQFCSKTWEYPVHMKLLHGNMPSASQQLLSAGPPCCWLHVVAYPLVIQDMPQMLQRVWSYSLPLKQMHWSLYLVHSSNLAKGYCAAFPPRLLKNKQLNSHLSYGLVKTVSSFGSLLPSLLLPSSQEKPCNSSNTLLQAKFLLTLGEQICCISTLLSSCWYSHRIVSDNVN